MELGPIVSCDGPLSWGLLLLLLSSISSPSNFHSPLCLQISLSINSVQWSRVMSPSLPHGVADHDTQLVLQSSHIAELVSLLEYAITTPRTQKPAWRVITFSISTLLPTNNIMQLSRPPYWSRAANCNPYRFFQSHNSHLNSWSEQGETQSYPAYWFYLFPIVSSTELKCFARAGARASSFAGLPSIRLEEEYFWSRLG